MNSISKSKWWAQALGFVAVAILAAIYYFYYVPHQRDYFAKRNFRVLELMSEQIKLSIEAMPGALKIAARSIESDKGLPTAVDTPDLVDRIRKAMELIPRLTLVAPPKVVDPAKASEPSKLVLPLNGSEQTKISIRQVLGAYWVEFEYLGYVGLDKSRLVALHARADLNQLAGSPREFDGLLIAEEGTLDVVFQKLPPGIAIQKLTMPAAAKESSLESTPVQRGSSLVTAPIAGEKYKIFARPLQIVHSTPEQRKDWIVCGLVRATRFEQESLELPYIYLIIFVFLILFSVSSVAFPQVGFAGPTEPLRRRHVIMLAVGTCGGAALLTVLLLDFGIYLRMENRMDARLDLLAKRICDNFKLEVDQLYTLLRRFDKIKTKSNNQSYVFDQPTQDLFVAATKEGPNARFDRVFWIGGDGVQTAKWGTLETTTPPNNVRARSYFQDALSDRNSPFSYRTNGTNKFWLEPIYSLSTGANSVGLSMRHPNPTSANEVVAIESRLESLIRPVLPTGYGFCVVTADGKVLFHSDVQRSLRENLFEECDNAALLRAAILSRANQKLETNYLGRNHQFHVTPIQNLPWTLVVYRDEHFLSAANLAVTLISLSLMAMYFLVPAALVVLCRGLPWLLNWSRGRTNDLSLIPDWLWPDKRHLKDYWVLSALNLLLALMVGSGLFFIRSPSLAGATAVAAVVLGTAAAYFRLRPRSQQEKSPPEPRKRDVIDWIFRPLFKLTSPFLPRSLKNLRNRHVYQQWYVAGVISLVILTAVVPAFACFKIALDQGIELLVQHGQFTFATAVRERAERIKNDSRLLIEQFRNLESDLKLEYNARPRDIYYGRKLGIEIQDEECSSETDTNSPEESRLHWLIDKVTPLRRMTAAVAGALLEKSADDGSWNWEFDPEKGMVLVVNNYRPGFSDARVPAGENPKGQKLVVEDPRKAYSLRVRTWIDDFPSAGWLPGIGLSVFVLMGTLLLFPVWFVAHRVLLVDVESKYSSPIDLEPDKFSAMWRSCSDSEKLALYYMARHGLINAANPGLAGLLNKGLLVKSPVLTLAGGEKFRQHVLASTPQEMVQASSHAVTGTGWALIRGPIYVGLAAVAFLLFTTQPDVYKVVIALVTGFAAGPPAILKMLKLFESDKTDEEQKEKKPQ